MCNSSPCKRSRWPTWQSVALTACTEAAIASASFLIYLYYSVRASCSSSVETDPPLTSSKATQPIGLSPSLLGFFISHVTDLFPPWLPTVLHASASETLSRLPLPYSKHYPASHLTLIKSNIYHDLWLPASFSCPTAPGLVFSPLFFVHATHRPYSGPLAVSSAWTPSSHISPGSLLALCSTITLLAGPSWPAYSTPLSLPSFSFIHLPPPATFYWSASLQVPCVSSLEAGSISTLNTAISLKPRTEPGPLAIIMSNWRTNLS